MQCAVSDHIPQNIYDMLIKTKSKPYGGKDGSCQFTREEFILWFNQNKYHNTFHIEYHNVGDDTKVPTILIQKSCPTPLIWIDLSGQIKTAGDDHLVIELQMLSDRGSLVHLNPFSSVWDSKLQIINTPLYQATHRRVLESLKNSLAFSYRQAMLEFRKLLDPEIIDMMNKSGLYHIEHYNFIQSCLPQF